MKPASGGAPPAPSQAVPTSATTALQQVEADPVDHPTRSRSSLAAAVQSVEAVRSVENALSSWRHEKRTSTHAAFDPHPVADHPNVSRANKLENKVKYNEYTGPKTLEPEMIKENQSGVDKTKAPEPAAGGDRAVDPFASAAAKAKGDVAFRRLIAGRAQERQPGADDGKDDGTRSLKADAGASVQTTSATASTIVGASDAVLTTSPSGVSAGTSIGDAVLLGTAFDAQIIKSGGSSRGGFQPPALAFGMKLLARGPRVADTEGEGALPEILVPPEDIVAAEEAAHHERMNDIFEQPRGRAPEGEADVEGLVDTDEMENLALGDDTEEDTTAPVYGNKGQQQIAYTPWAAGGLSRSSSRNKEMLLLGSSGGFPVATLFDIARESSRSKRSSPADEEIRSFIPPPLGWPNASRRGALSKGSGATSRSASGSKKPREKRSGTSSPETQTRADAAKLAAQRAREAVGDDGDIIVIAPRIEKNKIKTPAQTRSDKAARGGRNYASDVRGRSNSRSARGRGGSPSPKSKPSNGVSELLARSQQLLDRVTANERELGLGGDDLSGAEDAAAVEGDQRQPGDESILAIRRRVRAAAAGEAYAPGQSPYGRGKLQLPASKDTLSSVPGSGRENQDSEQDVGGRFPRPPAIMGRTKTPRSILTSGRGDEPETGNRYEHDELLHIERFRRLTGYDPEEMDRVLGMLERDVAAAVLTGVDVFEEHEWDRRRIVIEKLSRWQELSHRG